jgi:hypothetical protein
LNVVTLFDVRVVFEPRVSQVGDKTLVTVRVADNPRGEKNKAKYLSRFIDCTFSGFDADRAQTLEKGDVITVTGEEFEREYDPNAKGKKGGKGKAAAKGKKGAKAPAAGDGEKRIVKEIPFARLMIAPWKDDEDESEDAAAESEETETEEAVDDSGAEGDEFGLGDGDDPLEL